MPVQTRVVKAKAKPCRLMPGKHELMTEHFKADAVLFQQVLGTLK